MQALLFFALATGFQLELGRKHHRHHHHHSHHKHAAVATKNATASANVTGTEEQIKAKMKALEAQMGEEAAAAGAGTAQGQLIVNGPLPADFEAKFQAAVADATGCDPNSIKILSTQPAAVVPAFVQLLQKSKVRGGEVTVKFEGPAAVVAEVEQQASNPESKLVNGALHDFLVADDTPAAAPAPARVDVDSEMPYGELEPFGREDTAQELTDQSIHESDEMVDQLERAEVAEEKRSVFRAITRLRGAAITSFDGIARAQTGNIDEYAHTHQWRDTHPLHHLADEESDVSKWAFPDNAD